MVVKVEAEVGKPVLVVVVAAGLMVEAVDAGDDAVNPMPSPKSLVLPLAKFEKDIDSPGLVVVFVDNEFVIND